MTRPRRRPPLRVALVLLPLLLAGCAIPRWPVEGPMTSAFGVRWRGVLPQVHRGVDISVPTGTEVKSMAGGVVRYAGWQGSYGNVVWIDHGGSVLTVYAHLSEIRVAAGQPVRAGQVVALSGASGNASGPHLHFEVWRWSQQVDPVPLLGGYPGR